MRIVTARGLAVLAGITFLAACQTAARQDAADTNAGRSAAAEDQRMANPATVQLTLDRSSYSAGAITTLTLTNATARDLGYNPCTRTIERQSGGNWAVVPEPDRVCTMELRLLAAGARVTERTDLPDFLQAGTYRMVLRLSDESPPPSGGAPVRATSAPFTIG
jgi:hypothetical protein